MIEKQLAGKDLQKYIKEKMVDLIIVYVDGFLIQADKMSRAYMADAIDSAKILNISGVEWLLADNTRQILTIPQLEQARALGIQIEGEIIMKANAGILTFDDLRRAQRAYDNATTGKKPKK